MKFIFVSIYYLQNDDSYEVDVIEDETIDVQEDLLLNDENIQANENEVLFEDDSVQGFFCHKSKHCFECNWKRRV